MKSLVGFKVLIVDDDTDLRELVSEEFLIAGAHVEAASSGNNAIDFIKKNQYDFILSDLRMPDGDGYFLANEILKISGPKPLFFIYSGYNDISESQLIELGIEEIFCKPFVMKDIIKSILMRFANRAPA